MNADVSKLVEKYGKTVSLKVLSESFDFIQAHGQVDKSYCTIGEDGHGVKPEGFCLLANGQAGYCDYWGSTWTEKAEVAA